MEILLQSDGQLYPPRHTAPPKEPPKAKPPVPPPPPPPAALKKDAGIGMEELLLIGVSFLIIRNADKPDIPLLLALAYVLFDRDFSLGKLLG